jgi:type II secretory pathway component PulK
MVTHRKGVALIFTLWLLVLVGLAAAEIVTRARTETAIVTDMRARALGQYAAESGILLATSQIESLLDSATTPAQKAHVFHQLTAYYSSPHESVLGDAHFAVALLDLNARLDVNRTDPTTLRAFFSQFSGDADDIVTALKQAPISRFPEIARVPGVDDDLAVAIAPYITVWGDGLININSAPLPVLASIASVGKAGAQSIVTRRESGEVLTSADAYRGGSATSAVAVDAPLLTITPSRIMLVSRGWQPGTPLAHEIQAVYVVVSNRLVLQSWEERDR